MIKQTTHINRSVSLSRDFEEKVIDYCNKKNLSFSALVVECIKKEIERDTKIK